MPSPGVGVRFLRPSDVHPPQLQRLGDLLQLLAAHGDRDFLEGLYWLVEHRALWLIERDELNP